MTGKICLVFSTSVQFFQLKVLVYMTVDSSSVKIISMNVKIEPLILAHTHQQPQTKHQENFSELSYPYPKITTQLYEVGTPTRLYANSIPTCTIYVLLYQFVSFQVLSRSHLCFCYLLIKFVLNCSPFTLVQMLFWIHSFIISVSLF